MEKFGWQKAARIGGRLLVALIFILGGLNKILNYSETLVLMKGAGLEPASVLLPITILLELGAALLVAIGGRRAIVPAIALAIFTLATNYFFHDFWDVDDTLRAMQLSLFVKNISIVGALLFIAAASAESEQA